MEMDQLVDTLASVRLLYINAAFAIGAPSFLLYCSELVVIIRHKQFHNSFNKLFITLGLYDLLNMLASYYGSRLPFAFGTFLLPFYKQLPAFLLAQYWFLSMFCNFSDNLATAFINRFTAIAFPFSYEKLCRRAFPFSLLLIHAVPLFFAYPFLGMETTLAIISAQNETISSFSIAPKESLANFSKISTAFSVVLLIGCTLLNCISLLLYKRTQMRTSHGGMMMNGGNGEDKIERNLLIYSLCTFAGRSTITLLAIGFYLKPTKSLSTLFSSLLPLVSDLATVVMPSWLMLLTNPTFRQQWAADFRPKWWHFWSKSTNVINVQPQSNQQKY